MKSEYLYYLTAVEILHRIRGNPLEAVIERTEVVEPKTSAFTHTIFESTLSQAKRSESRYHK